jgi:putative transposase
LVIQRVYAQENGNFNNVHVWTYGLLLRRIREVAEEYGISVIYVDEEAPHRDARYMVTDAASGYTEDCSSARTLNESVFNADLAAA